MNSIDQMRRWIKLTESAIGDKGMVVDSDEKFQELAQGKSHGTAKPIEITIKWRVASEDTVLQTLEGEELAKKGGIIVTGTVGEQYAISPEKFPKKYNIIKANSDNTAGYATKIVGGGALTYIDPMVPFQAKTWAGVIHGDSNDILIRYGENDYGIIKKMHNGKPLFTSLYTVSSNSE